MAISRSSSALRQLVRAKGPLQPGSGCALTRSVQRPLAVVPSTTLAGRATASGASFGENTVSRKATSGADTCATKPTWVPRTSS